MLELIIGLLFFAVVFLPIKTAFCFSVLSTFMFIVYDGNDIASFLFLILILRYFLKYGIKKHIFNDRFIKVIIFIFFASLISLIFFYNPTGLQYLRRIFLTAIILILFVDLFKTKEDLNLFFKYIIIAVALLSLHVYTQTIFDINPFAQSQYLLKGDRLLLQGMGSQAVNVNTIGSYILWGSILILVYSKYVKSINILSKNLVFILILLNFVVISLILGSRATFFTMIIVVASLYLRLSNILKLSILSFLLFLVFQSVNFNSNEEIKFSLIERLQNESDLKDENSRYFLAISGLKSYSKSPIIGHGVGNESDSLYEIVGKKVTTHNTYISMLTQFGIIGIIIFIYFYRKVSSLLSSKIFRPILLSILIFGFVNSFLLLSLPWVFMSFGQKLDSLNYN